MYGLPFVSGSIDARDLAVEMILAGHTGLLQVGVAEGSSVLHFSHRGVHVAVSAGNENFNARHFSPAGTVDV